MDSSLTNKKTPWILLAPTLLIIGFSVILPIVITFQFSLKNYNLTDPASMKFIGLKNYLTVLKDPAFWTAFTNSVIILLVVTALGLLASLAVACVLKKKTRLSPILTAIVIIPWALPPIVNGIMWKFIFFPGYGLINKILMALGFVDGPISWVNDRFLCMLVISFVVIWRVVPFSALVFLANMQNIPTSYYEAMAIDGGNCLQTFRKITLPLLLPSFGVVMINLTTTAVNVYDEIIALAGYQFQTQTLLVYNYTNTFEFLEFGLGSAISYLIMLLTGVFGFLYVRNMTSERVYEV